MWECFLQDIWIFSFTITSRLVMRFNNGNQKSFPQDELTAVETHPSVMTRLKYALSQNSGV
jgi:hypothetical protein